MDLARHREVLWNHRRLLTGGLCLGVILAYMATFRLGTVTLRRPVQWTSASTLLVTQTGFPWGRASLPSAAQPNSPLVPLSAVKDPKSLNFADPGRFSSLAVFYAALLESNPIRALIPGGYPDGAVVATAGTTGRLSGTSSVLPMIVLSTTATGRSAARELNIETVSAFDGYLIQQQDASNVPTNDRVQVKTLNPPVERKSSKSGLAATVGVVLFVLLATVAVAYLHDNVTYRRRAGGDMTSASTADRWTAADPV
jgi:hypothetical protein